jgi:hypothetical protein
LAQLAQAYIHLKPYSASDKKLRSLGRYAKRLAQRRAAEIYGRGVIVEIELEEGSLKTRITVVGSILLGTYGGIADYKSFKDSVVEMCSDAKAFSADVCAPFTKKAGVSKGDVYRFERRLKTPGRLYSLGRDLEKLEKSTAELSPRDVQKELARLRGKLDAIAADLSASEINSVVSGLKAPHLPRPQKWPINDGPPKHAVRKTEDQPSLFFDDEAAQEDHSAKGRIVFRSRTLITEDVRPKRIFHYGQTDLPVLKS